MGMDFMDEETMRLKYMLDMYNVFNQDEEKRQTSLLEMNMSFSSLDSINFSPFEDLDLLTLVGLEFQDVMRVLFNTPIQVDQELRKEFKKARDRLMYELTDSVKDKYLIQIYFRKFMEKVLDRIDLHTQATGLTLLELGTQTKMTGSFLTKLSRDVKNQIRDRIDKTNEEDEEYIEE